MRCDIGYIMQRGAVLWFPERTALHYIPYTTLFTSLIPEKKMTKFNWITCVAVCLFGLLNNHFATAQIVPADQHRYDLAVRMVRAGEYERGKADLNPIIQQRGPLAPYASYYYAIAAFRQRNFNQARLMLRQLTELFPDWRRMDEARYLLAASYMEMGNYSEALDVIREINSATLRQDVTKLEQNFVPRITDLNQLKQLNKAYPADRVIGLSLINLIQQKSGSKEDLELSDQLTNRFGAPDSVTTQPSAATIGGAASQPATRPARNARQKGYYNVALMFPFRVDEFDADQRGRSNQYAYELYNGIKMAKSKLQEEGITVNLFAYDVDNDANKTLEIVNSPTFAQTDLIIGPLYAEPNRIATAYANQNGIFLLNPMATSSELVLDQPMSFLAQPSLNQQARKAAEQAQSIAGSRRVAIYFGTSRKDSLLAEAYRAELTQQKYQIIDFRKLSGTAQAMADSMQLTPKLSRSSATATPQPVPVNLGHVFFAGSNEQDGARILDALNRRKVSASLIATASAFDFYRNSSSTFTRRDLYLLYPDFVDNSREPVINFEQLYLAKRNTIPSVFALQGYDMMLFFGRQLAKDTLRNRNRKALRSEDEDYLLSGFDYTETNENQIAPIVKYEGGRLVKIN